MSKYWGLRSNGTKSALKQGIKFDELMLMATNETLFRKTSLLHCNFNSKQSCTEKN
jgi:hypothetical protein